VSMIRISRTLFSSSHASSAEIGLAVADDAEAKGGSLLILPSWHLQRKLPPVATMPCRKVGRLSGVAMCNRSTGRTAALLMGCGPTQPTAEDRSEV
jgi:hypothetical protein